ncbi:MAG: hypothetical protein WBQ19_20215 [Terriglobales bacterium]|jgi:hypothetical protein
MNKPDRADVRQVNVKVNGITFESVRLRHDLGANDFDILIDDPNLGRFGLTSGFDLEWRNEGPHWQEITLDELKNILDGDQLPAQVPSLLGSYQTLERKPLSGVGKHGGVTPRPRSAVEEGEHLMNAEIVLFRAGIAFLQLPWQRDRFASSVLMVSSVPKARACLLRAGFQPKVESETVLFDSRNGQPIQLIQGKYRLPRTKS